jgi:hypothetical protein
MGRPVSGAVVNLLRVSDFSQPPVADPGPGLYVASTVSGAGGVYVFDHIPYDDYHVMARYAGLTVFRYFVPALSVEVVNTKSEEGRMLVPRTLERILAGDSVVIHVVGGAVALGYNATGTVAGSYGHRLGILVGAQLAPSAQVVRYDPIAYGSLSDAAIPGWSDPAPIQNAVDSSQVISTSMRDCEGGWTQSRAAALRRRSCSSLRMPLFSRQPVRAGRYLPEPMVWMSMLPPSGESP